MLAKVLPLLGPLVTQRCHALLQLSDLILRDGLEVAQTDGFAATLSTGHNFLLYTIVVGRVDGSGFDLAYERLYQVVRVALFFTLFLGLEKLCLCFGKANELLRGGM